MNELGIEEYGCLSIVFWHFIKFRDGRILSALQKIFFRLSLGNALLELVKPWNESVKTVSLFLPGICCRMTRLACMDLNTAIIDTALKVLQILLDLCV